MNQSVNTTTARAKAVTKQMHGSMSHSKQASAERLAAIGGHLLPYVGKL